MQVLEPDEVAGILENFSKMKNKKDGGAMGDDMKVSNGLIISEQG